MDFDPRDFDSRDDDRFASDRHRGGSSNSHDDFDRDDDLRLPDIRSRADRRGHGADPVSLMIRMDILSRGSRHSSRRLDRESSSGAGRSVTRLCGSDGARQGSPPSRRRCAILTCAMRSRLVSICRSVHLRSTRRIAQRLTDNDRPNDLSHICHTGRWRASKVGCGGVQPAVLAAVERGGVSRD